MTAASPWVRRWICADHCSPERLAILAGLVRRKKGENAPGVPRGLYADHLLLSSDTRKEYKKTRTVFAPKLSAAGVGEDTLRKVLEDNPRRFLAFVPKRG